MIGLGTGPDYSREFWPTYGAEGYINGRSPARIIGFRGTR